MADCGGENVVMEETMRTETDEIRDNLKYLTLLSRDYPSQAAAASVAKRAKRAARMPTALPRGSGKPFRYRRQALAQS